MSSKKKSKSKLITDKNTDYLFDYFMNEDKFNEQMRGEWDEQMEKKLENRQPKLDSRILTEKKNNKIESSSTPEEKELPSSESSQSGSDKPDVEFNDDNSENGKSESSIQSSAKSPYGQKIEEKIKTDSKPKPDTKPDDFSDRPLLGEKLIDDVQKYVETPEERRARAREEYSKLQDLVEKYGVRLTKDFTINDDPDEMKAEYDMHKERRNKNNQVKFYKNILLNIICGIEFLNERYDPFAFKLKDWSKQVAADMDDYTEVLEEIYEKYKDKGGKMAPEIRLLFMIIMSGVTFHLSQALFGSGGLNDTINKNPNILNKLLGGLVKGGLGGSNEEPAEAKEAPNNNKDLLAAIKKHNQNKQSDGKNDRAMTTENKTETSAVNSEAIAMERQNRLLAEQKALYEAQMRKQQEMFMTQMDQLKNQQQNVTQPVNYIPPTQQPVHTQQTVPSAANLILSDASKKPRFLENHIATNNTHISDNINRERGKKASLKKLSEELDIFDSEIKDNTNPKNVKPSSAKKPKRPNIEDLIESLEESTDVDIDDIIETSSKKRGKQQPIKKSTNSATRSATRSASKRRNTDSITEGLSTSKKNNNVVKL